MPRHSTDLLSLAFGLAFATLGLVLVAGGDGAPSLGWVAPIATVALGVLVIAAARSTASASEPPPPED